MKETPVKIRALTSVAARAALFAVFTIVVALSIGCHSEDESCVDGEWRCDSSRKEIEQCVNQKWVVIQSCFGVDEYCVQGLGQGCHGPDTACCVLNP